VLGDLGLVEPEQLEDLEQDDHARDDRRRAVGWRPGVWRRCSSGTEASWSRDPLALRAADHVAVDLVGVVRVELFARSRRVRSRVPATPIARSTERRSSSGAPAARILWASWARAFSSVVSAGRCGCGARSSARPPVWGRDVEGHLASGPDHELRSSRRRCRTRGVGVRSSGSRSLVAPRNVSPASSSPGQDVRLDAVAVLDRVGELPPVGGRRGRRSSGPRSPSRPRARRSAACICRGWCRRAASRRRRGCRRRRPAGAEPRDRRDPLELLRDAAVVDVGDQQPRRVGADIDDRGPSRLLSPWCGIGWPSSAASRLSTARSAISARARFLVADPMCGVTIRFGRLQQRVVGRERFGRRRVERGAGDQAVVEPPRERGLVDELPARRVDQDRRTASSPRARGGRSGGGSPTSAGRGRRQSRTARAGSRGRWGPEPRVVTSTRISNPAARSATRAPDPPESDDPDRRP